jgi:hypothetical protein
MYRGSIRLRILKNFPYRRSIISVLCPVSGLHRLESNVPFSYEWEGLYSPRRRVKAIDWRHQWLSKNGWRALMSNKCSSFWYRKLQSARDFICWLRSRELDLSSVGLCSTSWGSGLPRIVGHRPNLEQIWSSPTMSMF